jgi:uncharacterized protein YcbX
MLEKYDLNPTVKYNLVKSQVNLVDEAPVMLVSEASLGDLNGRLSSPVRMNRHKQ